MRLCLILVLAFLPLGCGKGQTIRAGGKPVAYWAQALHDPDVRLRRKAVAKLGNVGPVDPAVLPALTAALQDRDAGVRREAILALVKFGPGAAEAIPALVRARQHDRSPAVRSYAARALARFSQSDW